MNCFRMSISLAITEKALGGLLPSDRARIQKYVGDRMMAEGKRAFYEALGMKEPSGNIIEHDPEVKSLEHHGTPA